MYSDRKYLGKGETGGRDYKGEWKNFGDDGYVYSLDCGDGFMGGYIYIYIYVTTDQIVHFKYVKFIVCHLCLSKAV